MNFRLKLQTPPHRFRPLWQKLHLTWAIYTAVFLLIPVVYADTRDTPSPSKEISIIAKDLPLIEILKSIEVKSGIRFVVPDELKGRSISAHVKASNWPEAINKLLKKQSRVEVWGEHGQLTTVKLLAGGNIDHEKPNTQSGQANNPDGNISNSTDREPGKLEIIDLELITQGKRGSPLPIEVLQDPKYNNILKKAGIESVMDLEDAEKVRKVRTLARKKLGKALIRSQFGKDP